MNVGLVLSGGMAKGAYELGALKAISEYFAPGDIKYVSSASVGALNSFAFSCGKLDYAFSMWRGLNDFNEKLFIKTALSSDYLKNSIGELSGYNLLSERFYIPLFNLKSRNNYYIDLNMCDTALTREYLNASVAVFPICEPVFINGRHYYDGALLDNIPVYPLLKCNLDYIICIYYDKYNYVFESRYFDNKIIKITFYDDKEILNKSIWFTKNGTEEMISSGYKKAKTILDFVLSGGADNAESVYSRIEELNSLNTNGRVRLTGDVAINGLNRIAGRVTGRRFL